MTTTTGKATGSFTIKAWDEQPWAEVEEAPKLTHARVTTAYTGDLEGEGTYQLLVVYHGTDATYAGYERVAGSWTAARAASCSGSTGGTRRSGPDHLDGGRGVGHRRPGRPPGRGGALAGRASRYRLELLVAGLFDAEAETADTAAVQPVRTDPGQLLVASPSPGKAGSRRLWSLGMPGRSPPPR